MIKIHLECKPDETIVKKLGLPGKMIRHHSGKSRVFAELKKTEGQIGMVDEDPKSAKCDYERSLKVVTESCGIKKYSDKNGNIVLMLTVKLEDWIIETCKKDNINIVTFGLPVKPNKLHEEIINRIQNFEKLIDHLKEINNKNIKQLENWLKGK